MQRVVQFNEMAKTVDIWMSILDYKQEMSEKWGAGFKIEDMNMNK